MGPIFLVVVPVQPLLITGFLIGRIPDPFGNLTKLRHLNLGGNQLSGERMKLVIPVQPLLITAFFIGKIPESFGSLASLQFLELQSNQLNGVFKSGHTSTTTFDHCILTGAIPDSFGNLAKLRCLDLRWNKLTGSKRLCGCTSWTILFHLIFLI